MFCRNCGAKIKAGAAFCAKCGTKLQKAGHTDRQSTQRGVPYMSVTDSRETDGGEIPDSATRGSKKADGRAGFGRKLAIGGIAVCAAMAVLVVVRLLLPGDRFPALSLGQQSGEGIGTLEGSDGGGLSSEEGAAAGQEEPLYQIDEIDRIDLDAENHAPGTKAAGMVWDKSLFYWLEDVDTLSPDDGYIARCRIAKTFLRNGRDGGLIQYEIYSDPGSGEIYKIVSIQEKDGELELTDYYYVDGKPNFAFLRYDSVYTPTYATISKTGERFYFDSDALVKWRIISVPQEIKEYTLSPDDPWYSQANYFEEPAEIQAAYDEAERRMLNRAYNTYEAVSGRENVGLVEGRLLDTVGNPVAGAEVCIYRGSDDALMYRTSTGEDGKFGIYVYMDGTVCYLHVKESSEYRESAVYGLELADSASSFSYDLTMHKLKGDEYPVTLCAYPALEIRAEDQGQRQPVGGVTAYIREGLGAYQGDVLVTVTADTEEMLHTNLVSGTYTAQFTAEGYQDTYLEFSVDERAVNQAAYVVPELEEGRTAIVLTWDGDDVDLDLTLFTPFQSADGDMDHIGGGVTEDGHGNSLVWDNDGECEVLLVNSGQQGTYKLYVNNYTEIQAGNYASPTLHILNVHVYIYNSSGFSADYTVPVGQDGVVWEAAEINGNTVMSVGRVYTQISGKAWWLEKKGQKRLVRRTESFEGGAVTEYLYEYSYEENYPYGNGNNGTLETVVDRNRQGEVYSATEYIYDDQGNLMEEHGYRGEVWAGSYSRSYDGQGRLMAEWLRYYGDIEYQYDSNGNLVRETHYADYATGLDGVSGWYEYRYDDKGNLQEKVQYDRDGNISGREEYSCDDQGNLVKSVSYDGGGNRSGWEECTYNSRGDLIRSVTYGSDGDCSSQGEYSYDRWGNLTEETMYGGDGNIIYQYHYFYE